MTPFGEKSCTDPERLSPFPESVLSIDNGIPFKSFIDLSISRPLRVPGFEGTVRLRLTLAPPGDCVGVVYIWEVGVLVSTNLSGGGYQREEGRGMSTDIGMQIRMKQEVAKDGECKASGFRVSSR